MTIIATGALVYRRPKVPEHLWSKSHNQEFELYYGTVIIFIYFLCFPYALPIGLV